MKTKIVLFFEVALAVGFLTAASVQAVPTTYQYTGNPFTDVTAPYTTSDFVSGMVTLVGPLAPNMPLTFVSATAFTFSDGVQTFTNLSLHIFSFEFATGPTGAITAWIVGLDTGAGPQINTNNLPPIGVGDTGVNVTRFGGGSGSNFGSPGVWATVGGVADTGSTLSLMTLTLMALAVAARQFNRAAA